MMKYFFDVPVYRLSEDEHDKGLKEFVNAQLAPCEDFLEKNPDLLVMHKEVAIKNYGGIWQYNQIIGYIRLYILGSQVRGEYYVNDARIHVRKAKKRFKYITHKLAIEVELPLTESNDVIYQVILSYLKDCQKELKRRYVDISLFQAIGPYVDWKALMDV